MPTATPTPTPVPTPTPTPAPETAPYDVPEGVLLSYINYEIHKVSDKPLFKANGSVDADVLNSLMEVLNDPLLDPLMRNPKTSWTSGLAFTGSRFIEVTAEDFSNFVVPDSTDINNTGAVVIKLFETVPDQVGVHNNHITEFTSQWWQLVYRATDDDNDVLTLWMMQPYRISPFSGTRYDDRAGNTSDRFTDRMRAQGDSTWSRIQRGTLNTVLCDERILLGLPPCDTYFFEGNYSASIARANLLRDTTGILEKFKIDSYLVAPDSLPGLWQSSISQTGTNIDNEYYVSGNFFRSGRDYDGSESETDGLGATGLIWGSRNFFTLVNGMDGLSVGPYNSNWPNTSLVSTYDDLFWLPSDFEVRTMGYDKESIRIITTLADADNRTSALRITGGSSDEESEETQGIEESEENEENEEISDTAEIEEIERNENRIGTGRSGLWQLNGFDRAFDRDGLGLPRGWMTEQVWLRSQESLGIGNISMVMYTGNRNNYGVHQLAGMRPAVHLSITQLIGDNG